MRHEPSFHASNIAFEVDADYIDGDGCTCLLCRPHGPFLSFVSRDNLNLTASTPAPKFHRQRLTHHFTTASQNPPAHSGTDFGRWAGHGRLTFRRPIKQS